MSSFVPYDFGGCELPEDFWDHIVDEGFNDELGLEGWFTDYPDSDNDGYADFYDQYLDNEEPGIIVKPSQGHAGT